MYRRWIYMCLVFYLTLETSYCTSQCYDDKICECHCNCCSNCLGFYCTSCNREGWSGLTANGCQRKNIAYNQTTYQKSTNTDSSNAVDEKISTYSRTEVQKNPWIKVKFDKIERVKHMFITLSAGIGSYFVYVKNSSNENLDRESLCARIQNNERQSLKWNITCKNDQAITGDQIVILRETTRGSLIVYDIKVFQCSTGTYGYLCDKTCVKCMDNQCDRFTGVCIKGCKSGWYGDRCDVECPSDCESGSCTSGNNCTRCLPGYHGIFCNGNCFKNCYNCTSGSYDCEACKPGFHGSYCQYDCSSKCLTCDSADSCTSCRESWSGSSCQCNSKCADGCGNNGKCWNGCNGSFYGDYCDIPCPSDSCEKCDQKLGNCTECTKGRYGIHCDMDCSGTCLETACDIAGGCLRGCVEGFSGTNCAEQLIPSNSTSSTTPYVYVVAVLGGLLLVLTITLVTFFVKRKRERERTIRMTYQTVQVGCQKTDHDYECVSIEHDYGTIDS